MQLRVERDRALEENDHLRRQVADRKAQNDRILKLAASRDVERKADADMIDAYTSGLEAEVNALSHYLAKASEGLKQAVAERDSALKRWQQITSDIMSLQHKYRAMHAIANSLARSFSNSTFDPSIDELRQIADKVSCTELRVEAHAQASEAFRAAADTASRQITPLQPGRASDETTQAIVALLRTHTEATTPPQPAAPVHSLLTLSLLPWRLGLAFAAGLAEGATAKN